MAKEFLVEIEALAGVRSSAPLTLADSGLEAELFFDAGSPDPTLFLEIDGALVFQATEDLFYLFGNLTVAGAGIRFSSSGNSRTITFDDIDLGEYGEIMYDQDLDYLRLRSGGGTGLLFVSDSGVQVTGGLTVSQAATIGGTVTTPKLVIDVGINTGILADRSDSTLRISGGTTDITGGNIALYGPSATSFESKGRLNSDAGVVLEWAAGEVGITGNLVVSSTIDVPEIYLDGGSPSTGNMMLRFTAKSGSNYDFFADSTGAGSDDSRLWLDTPTAGEVVIGPRSGGVRLHQVRIRADNLVLDTPPYSGATGYPVAYVRNAGSWTPTVEGTTGNPTLSYSAQSGTFVRINQMVYFVARIALASRSGGSGVFTIGGLPYTCKNDNNARSSISLTVGGVTFPVSVSYLTGLMVQNSTKFNIFGHGSGIALTSVPITNVSNSLVLWASGFYETSDS